MRERYGLMAYAHHEPKKLDKALKPARPRRQPHTRQTPWWER